MIDQAIKDWEDLAVQQERMKALGLVHPKTADARIDTYRRTVKALQIQKETGVAVCSCHFKPFKENA